MQAIPFFRLGVGLGLGQCEDTVKAAYSHSHVPQRVRARRSYSQSLTLCQW